MSIVTAHRPSVDALQNDDDTDEPLDGSEDASSRGREPGPAAADVQMQDAARESDVPAQLPSGLQICQQSNAYQDSNYVNDDGENLVADASSVTATANDVSRVRLAEQPDHAQAQAQSPRSSATSQKKREASSSPSRSQIGRGSGVSKPRYVQSKSMNVASVAKRKQHVRTLSGLRSAPLLAKSNHCRTQSTGMPVPAYLFNASQQSNPPVTFVPTSYEKLKAYRHDSGYVGRQNTDQQASWNPDVRAPAYVNVSPNHIDAYGYGLAKQQSLPPPQPPRYDMVLQPKSSPLTQEQLGAEVKGIYAGLVMVEAKCINMDNARAANPNAEVTKEDWQTLIALHRTLLYEHHDFLMATQHPSAAANLALRGLASKYCMPARMWKHGIHSFLEVLRHRRPESQEYMLTFIYLAYQMICLLFDTIPSYKDTWIECLGDLARYRMAIEEDKEIHAVWCAVAARWYQMAADRHPQVGRLYHHLGILERPSLRKFYFYARSLTSVVPFSNAAESLGTLCAPILQDDTAIRCGNHSAEAMTICFHARVFTSQNKDIAQPLELIRRDGEDARNLLKMQPTAKIATYGVALAVTNIAAMFQYGLQENVFRAIYGDALARESHNTAPANRDPEVLSDAPKASNPNGLQQTSSPLEAVVVFWSSCFNSLIDGELNQGSLRDLMQYVHVNLVWISSLINLRSRLHNRTHVKLVDDLLARINWQKLAAFLNAISRIDPITQRVEEHAVHNIFLMPDRPAERKPLVEDYMLRGIVWAENYPSLELFYGIEDDDGSRTIDSSARLHLRAERVLWLACLIAQPVKNSGLQYDRTAQRFDARPLEEQTVPSTAPQLDRSTIDETSSTAPSMKHSINTDEASSWSPVSMDGIQTSPHSSTGEGFEMVSLAPDVRSLSSMDDSRMSTPMKSFVSVRSTTAMRGSPERNQFSIVRAKVCATSTRIQGDSEVSNIRGGMWPSDAHH